MKSILKVLDDINTNKAWFDRKGFSAVQVIQ